MFYNENLYYLLCSCTNPILGKILFLRYRPKCSQPIRLENFKINYFSRTNRWNSLIFVRWYKFWKIESWSKIFWLGMVKNECGQSGLWILKLTVSQEWAVGINWFFCMLVQILANSKVIENFWGGHGQKWVWPVWWWDSKIECIWRMNRWRNWFFTCWYRFTKTDSSNFFFLGHSQKRMCPV